MKVSIISDDKVNDSKDGFLSHVDGVFELDTLDEFGELLTLVHVAPAVFRDNRKRQDHLDGIEFVCLDFDDGLMNSEAVYNKLKDRWNFIIVGSKNHLRDKGDGKGVIERFHLFIQTDRPIVSVEFYKWLGKKVSSLYNFSVDNNCVEPSRYFYKHSQVLFINNDREPLNVSEWEWIKRVSDKETEIILKERRPKKVDNSEPLETFKRTKYFRMLTGGELGIDGERYYKSCQIIGAAKRCGLTNTDIMSLIDEYATYGKSFTRQSVERRVSEWI